MDRIALIPRNTTEIAMPMANRGSRGARAPSAPVMEVMTVPTQLITVVRPEVTAASIKPNLLSNELNQSQHQAPQTIERIALTPRKTTEMAMPMANRGSSSLSCPDVTAVIVVPIQSRTVPRADVTAGKRPVATTGASPIKKILLPQLFIFSKNGKIHDTLDQ
jgi:hypothetical protein